MSVASISRPGASLVTQVLTKRAEPAAFEGGCEVRSGHLHALPLAILVLVLQKARPKGWQVCDGAILTFDQVVKHLRAIAVAFAGVRIWCTATETRGQIGR